MKKNIIILLVVVLIVGVGIKGINEYRIKEAMEISVIEELNDHFYDEYEKISKAFIKNTFINEYNVLVDNQNIVTSLNLIYMGYLLNANDQEEFKRIVRFIDKHLLTQDGLVAFGGYRDLVTQEIKLINKSSLKDNLEFYKLLKKAYVLWEDPLYNNLAEKMAEKIYTYNVKEKRLYPYYGDQDKKELLDVQLYYIDLKVLASLSEHELTWKEIYQSSKEVLERAYINNNFPLYYSYYDYEDKSYIKNEKVDILDSLLVVKNLAYNNIYKEETIKWLKDQFKTGGIYEQYNYKTGLVTSHTENIAIYAVTAQIGKVIGDIELYTLAMEKMLSFQIKDAESSLYGAFVTKDTNIINCYDNLQALIAF